MAVTSRLPARARSAAGGGLAVQEATQLLAGREGDRRLLRNRDRRAGLRILHHAGRAAALGEGAEARVGEPRTLVAADAGADEVVAHLGEHGVDDLSHGFLGQLAREVLAAVHAIDELRLRHVVSPDSLLTRGRQTTDSKSGC